MSFTEPIPTLAPDEYDPPLGPRVWAGAIFIAASFGFLLLAGCFSIGILILINPSSLNGKPPPATALSAQEMTFLIMLYALAGLSVLAAGALFLLGLTGLVRILFGKATPA